MLRVKGWPVLMLGASETTILKSHWLKCFWSQLSIILIQVTIYGVPVSKKENYHDCIL